MNFFKLYMGDYQRDTGHLSIAEHGAYLLMLQHHYATEKPLPTGAALYRLLRADGAADKRAIDSVAKQFWTETSEGLVNERALAEFERAAELSQSNRDAANVRWGKKRNANGMQDACEVHTERIGNASKTHMRKPCLQTPDSSEDLRSSGAEPPLGSKSGAPTDPKKALWDIGVSVLGEPNRSLIGQACKRVGEPRVAEVLGQMAADPKADPKSWFIAATSERKRGFVC